MTLSSLVNSPSQALPARIATLSPNQALLICTVGICLIFLELNRPGRIIPGAVGLALCLLSGSSLAKHAVQPICVVVLVFVTGIFVLQLWKALPLWLIGCSAAALIVSLRLLIANTPAVSSSVALTCGLVVGLLSTVLARIALSARRLKAVH